MIVTSFPRARLGRKLFMSLCFLSGFCSAAFLVHLAAGYPEVGPLKDKLRYFAANKDELDLLFFGSSRIYRGVIPRRFDQEMAARGHAVRSFNFGIAGMQSHETSTLIRRVLAMDPERLRVLVVELEAWNPTIPAPNRYKKRAIFWHDFPETLSALRSTWLADLEPAVKVDLSLTHVLHLGAFLTAAGRGPEIVRGQLEAGTAAAAELDAYRGFRPFPERSYAEPSPHPFRRHFQRHLDAYRAALAMLPAANRVAVSLDTYPIAALLGQVRRIQAAGAQVIYVVPPIPRPTPHLRKLRQLQIVPALVELNDPDLYPDLFAVARRHDSEHLTQEGAESFTTHLAKRVLATLTPRQRLGDTL